MKRIQSQDKEFKRKMKNRGHSVWKHGNYIEIKPDNNIFGYGKGFINAYDIVQGVEDSLKFVSMDHFT